MFQDPLFVVVVVAVAIVAVILLTGIVTFGRGGEFNRKHANRIMRYRIFAQAVAIGLILLYIWLRRGGSENDLPYIRLLHVNGSESS